MNFGLWSSWVRVMVLNGRAFADTRSSTWPLARRLVFAAASPAIPFVRFARSVGHARRLGRGGAFLARVLPTIGVGLIMDGIGQMAGYAIGAGKAHERLAEFEWHRMKHSGAVVRRTCRDRAAVGNEGGIRRVGPRLRRRGDLVAHGAHHRRRSSRASSDRVATASSR